VSPDGTRLFVLGRPAQNNTLTTIPLANGGAPQTVVLPEIGYTVLNTLTTSPDGTKLFATDGATAGIRVFDAASLRLIQTISWTAGIRLPMGIAVMPDGSQIFTANVNSNNLGIVQQVQPA
jgi:DNA-binding beta-propeller fold protein YncE